MKVLRSAQFEREAQELLPVGWRAIIVEGLEWALRRSAELGQKVRGTNLQVWPLFPGDGYVYVAYYLLSGDEITLKSLVKRSVPVSPQIFDLED